MKERLLKLGERYPRTTAVIVIAAFMGAAFLVMPFGLVQHIRWKLNHHWVRIKRYL